MRKVYYIYNPKTRTYDRIYPTVRQRALSILRRLFVGMGLGAGSFIILLLIFGSPSEKELRIENARLLAQYNVLSHRLDEAMGVMQQAGEEMLREFFSREGVEYTPENIRKICNLHTIKTQEELFAAIGLKTIILGENDKNELKDKPTSSNWKKYISFAFGGSKTNKEKPTEEKEPLQKIDSKKILKLTPEAIQKNYVIAECCKPIPGDDVLGYIGDNNRIIIHKRQCPLATKLKSSYGNRLLAVQWETGKSLYFPVNIYIKGIDHIGLLNKVTEVISQQLNVNIHKLNIESNDGIFEGRIQLFVHDVDDVKSITTNLRKIDEIKTVTRIEKFEDQPN